LAQPVSQSTISPASAVSFAPIHFPWLTELRFFTAFAVLIHHIETTRHVEGLGPSPGGWMLFIGPHGVRLFFVLSGFLITHLLLSELRRTGTVAVKKFYMRRALRIWPLYFALLAVSFLLPTALLVIKGDSELATWVAAKMHDFPAKVALFSCLLPNLAILLYPPLVGFAQAWSIGVEEQFYLIWPVLVKRFGQYPLRALLGVLAAKSLVVFALSIVVHTNKIVMSYETRVKLSYVWNYINCWQIEAMVIGGLAAYLLIKKPDLVRVIARNTIFRAGVCISVLWALSAQWTSLQHLLLVDTAFAAMILCLTLSDFRLPSLFQRPLTYLGKISYGIYMLHPLAIFISFKLLSLTGMPPDGFAFTAAIWTMCIVSSLLFSVASYEWLEKRFLAIKTRYAVVASSAS
jgi:peptidoglycan/LPS O-acetylase OafA/YrhL